MVKKEVKYFFNDVSDEEPLLSCLEQIFDFLYKSGFTLRNILSATIFIQKPDNFKLYSAQIEKTLFRYNFDVPRIIVSQNPFKAEIALEVLFIDGNFQVLNAGNNYKMIERNNTIELYTAKTAISEYVYEASGIVFNEIYHLLRRHQISIENIVRQWNYIEKIYFDNNQSQNYQDFNEVRAGYYSYAKWESGYPSATGIGVANGGVGISLIAVKGTVEVFALKNPNQIDAHSYSKKVLIGNNYEKATPKFERGKIVINSKNIDIYISGTAAILGEDTIQESTIESQTLTTINNIFKLIDNDNLKANLPEKYHLRLDSLNIKENFSNIRVYVKNKEDIEKAEIICRESFGNIPMIFLHADICRENLLVEIEGSIFV